MRRTIALSLLPLLLVACAPNERDEMGFIEAAEAEWTDYRPYNDEDWIAIGDEYCANLDAMTDVASELADSPDSADPGWRMAAEYLCPRHSDEVPVANESP
jgi:hypothetical protein